MIKKIFINRSENIIKGERREREREREKEGKGKKREERKEV